ncbi:integrase catalytic domain-containing protein [Trichonephila clavipes]|nr:integrase catalytic domain-containing protein [Trichonephila clavipes]
MEEGRMWKMKVEMGVPLNPQMKTILLEYRTWCSSMKWRSIQFLQRRERSLQNSAWIEKTVQQFLTSQGAHSFTSVVSSNCLHATIKDSLWVVKLCRKVVQEGHWSLNVSWSKGHCSKSQGLSENQYPPLRIGKNPSWNTQLSVASVVATSKDAISPSEIGQALRKTYRRMYLRQIIPKRCLAARKAAERLKNKTAENKIWPRAQKKREWSPSVRTEQIHGGKAVDTAHARNRAETEGTEPQHRGVSQFSENTAASLSCTNRSKTVILPTAVVWVLNHSTGSCIQARAVLDSDSMSNIVTLDFANKLGAPQNRINIQISSLDGNKAIVKSELNATIINGNGSFSTTLDFLVVSKITDFLPVSQINLNNFKIPQELADPNFGVPGKIDLLIGAEAFFDIIKEEIIRTSDNPLVFRSSVFGYIATGTTHSYKQNQYCGFISEMQNIDDNLQKFWETEAINEGQKPLSKEEEYCENHYQMTHTRNEAGRYVVQMPVKDIQGLGHSKGLAMKRLDQLWRR